MPESVPKIGLLLPTRGLIIGDQSRKANLIVQLAMIAESEGLDSVWVGDSLTAKPRLEPLLTLASLAPITQKIKLGTAILIPSLRAPIALAQSTGTLDLLSNGRLILGVGAGGAFNQAQKQEWITAGISPRGRGGRLEETIQIVNGLLSRDFLDFDGTYYQFANVGIGLASFRITGVPVLFACHLGAKRPEQFDRAARLGNGFITISEDPQGFAQIYSHVKTAAYIHNKDFSSMEKVMYMTINLNDDLEIAKKESDQFLKAYYGINMWSQLWGPWGPSKLTIQRIQEFSESGASTIIIRFASFDVEKQLAKFLKEIWPYFS